MDTDPSDLEMEALQKELSATILQRLWRTFKHKRAIRQTVPSMREPIMVYYSSMPFTMKQKSDTDKLFVMMQGKHIKYFKLDLVDNKYAQAEVKEQLKYFIPPFIKVHNVFIGGYDQFEELVQADLLDLILDKDNFEELKNIEKHPQPNQEQVDEAQQPKQS